MSAPDSAVDAVPVVDLPHPSTGTGPCGDGGDISGSDDFVDFEDSEDTEHSFDSAEHEMFCKGKDIKLDGWTDTEDSDSEPEDSQAKRNRLEEDEEDEEDEEETSPSPPRASPDKTVCGLCNDQEDPEPQCPSSPMACWHSHEEHDVGPSPMSFRPLRPPGPQHESIMSKQPLDIFLLFFSEAIVSTLVENTNAYGAQRSPEMNETWTDITTVDMSSFISLALYMDYLKFPTMDYYWSDYKLCNLEFPRTVMSQSKFLRICQCLHLSSLDMDAENRALKRTPRHDPLGKIKPLYLKLAEACRANFQPDQNLCISERMVAQEHDGMFIDGGYRVFTLADSATGYTWNLSVCENKESSSADRALSYSSVINLMDTEHLGRGYHLYLDKAHSSPRIIRDLWAKGIGVCGIVAKTKKGFPRTLENDLTPSDARGSLRWARDGAVLFVKWKDAGEVAMCSTIHAAYNGDTIRKRQRVGGKWVALPVPFPPVAKDHSEHMRGVDDSEILTEHKNILLKTKWYQSLFFHFLNIAVRNSHILYNHRHKKQQKSQRWFLEMLVQQLVDYRGGNVTS